jgi:hypothetical protein
MKENPRARHNGVIYEYWLIGEGTVRYKIPGQLNFHTVSRADFEKHFEPIEDKPAAKPEPTQGGLFG